MKIALIVEGAYPYLTGGVSSWIQRMLEELEDVEFVIQTLVIDRHQKRTFKYDIPDNVSEIQEVYLFDDDYGPVDENLKLSTIQYQAFANLFRGENIHWEILFDFFSQENLSLNALFRSQDFLTLTKEFYLDRYPDLVFTDFLWAMRSMYEPLFSVLKSPLVEADLYHSLSTGYAGVLASKQSVMMGKPFLLSEHGIYTREREEELIKADWVQGAYKDIWINQFYKLSSAAYQYADRVTSLFPEAQSIQVELGCPPEKTLVIPNGVGMDNFKDLPEKDPTDDFINIGAILRVTPIKDVKTMINAFSLAKESRPDLKLWLIGPTDEDPEYVAECQELILDLELTDLVFTGTVNIKDYLGQMDFMALSSLSEGQPLVILEAFAAKKPYIATNVGDCRNLIYGAYDQLGPAGIVVPIMNSEELGAAMVELANDQSLRQQMAAAGYERARRYHQNEDIYDSYLRVFQELVHAEKNEGRLGLGGGNWL